MFVFCQIVHQKVMYVLVFLSNNSSESNVCICGFFCQIIRRRVIVPSHTESDSPPFKITLSKKNKKDGKSYFTTC